MEIMQAKEGMNMSLGIINISAHTTVKDQNFTRSSSGVNCCMQTQFSVFEKLLSACKCSCEELGEQGGPPAVGRQVTADKDVIVEQCITVLL